MEPIRNGEMEIGVTMWWADVNNLFDTTTEHIKEIMVTFETHFKNGIFM